MDLTAFFTMSYGLYVVSSEADGLKAGCIINTATQVTAEPPRMMVAVHKDNVTADVIAKAGKFAVTAIDKTADMPYIGNFGFRSSNTFDKFEKYGEERTGNGCPSISAPCSPATSSRPWTWAPIICSSVMWSRRSAFRTRSL